MKTLDEICNEHGADKGSLWHGYAKRYEEHFGMWRHSPVRLLEIGVQFGASMKAWTEYFDQAAIFGVDVINCCSFTHPRFRYVIGNQCHRQFWADFIAKNPGGFDIVIDDGGHMSSGIIPSFECLWPAVLPGGFYIIEDLFVSYVQQFRESGQPSQMSFIASLLDEINQHGKAFHGNPTPVANPTYNLYEQTIDYLHFYKGLAVIKKKV